MAVLGVKSRETGYVLTREVDSTDSPTVQVFVTDEEATVITDQAKACKGIPRRHETVNHSRCEYVRGRWGGIESFWAIPKRAYKGTFH